MSRPTEARSRVRTRAFARTRTRARRQAGMSGSGWFIVIIIVMGAASVGMRLIPHYLQHDSINGLILSLLEQPDLAGMNGSKIRRELTQMMKLNNIRDFELRDKLEVQKGAGTLEMDFKYEVREHMFWNVDVVLSFEEHYEKVL